MADIPLQSPSLITCAETGKACQLQQEMALLRDQVRDLAEKVHTDLLTGLHNYRYFQEVLPLEMERTLRTGQPLSIILLDVDHFKAFNDRWGHEAGNQALQRVGGLINESLRKLDIASRYGGEEFVIILPDTPLKQAIKVAERLRAMIEENPLTLDDTSVTLTVSLGVDEYSFHRGETSVSLLARTDQWLYQAKQAGRNRVGHPPVSCGENFVSSEEKAALFNVFYNSPED